MCGDFSNITKMQFYERVADNSRSDGNMFKKRVIGNICWTMGKQIVSFCRSVVNFHSKSPVQQIRRTIEEMESKEVFLSDNTVLDSVVFDDRTVEVIGYVDVLERPKIVGKNKKYKLIKFALNNGAGRRVQCIAWEAQVDRTATAVQLNKIIYLDGAQSKKIENLNYNLGNMPYELVIQSNTVINDLGGYETKTDQEIPEISLSDVADAAGKIKVKGYMKTLIALAEHEQGQSSQGIGAITDGVLKLEIHTTSTSNMPNLMKGDPVEVVGTVNHGKVVYLQLGDGGSIKKREGKKLSCTQMVSITQSPAKKAKLELAAVPTKVSQKKD